jgi:hypothetical protein
MAQWPKCCRFPDGVHLITLNWIVLLSLSRRLGGWMSIEEWTERHDRLKDIGKRLKRDIKAAVAQGKLPAWRYSVQTEQQWYWRGLKISTSEGAGDEERKILVAMALAYQDRDDPFSVHIDGMSAYVGSYSNSD